MNYFLFYPETAYTGGDYATNWGYMSHVTARCYAHLNRFLAYDRRQTDFTIAYDGPRSVKDLIESLGVPHTEVALILVNGEPVDFAYLVQEADRVSVYPRFEALDITDLPHVIPTPAAELRFVADVHLGRLAAYLRMLGFDTLYPDDYRDEALARLSSAEDRILLTRDRGLLKRSIVTRGYYVQETDPWRQLAEVFRRFNLRPSAVRFRRCTQCNGLLEPVDKDAIADRLPDNTRQYYDEFRVCQSCGKIYWKGSHYQQMDQFLASLSDSDTGNG